MRNRIRRVIIVGVFAVAMYVVAWEAGTEYTGKGNTVLAAKDMQKEGQSSSNLDEGPSSNSLEAEQDTLSQNEAGIIVEAEPEEPTAAENEYENLAIADVDRYVNVRSIPDTDGEIVGKIYDGAVAQILAPAGENQEWFQIVSGSVEGYVKAEFFIYGEDAAAVIEDYVARYATVRAERLNVREQPELEARRIGYADSGERLRLLEDCGEWLLVEYTGEEQGYVSAEYAIVSEEFIYAKSIEEEQAELEEQRKLAARDAVSEQNAPESKSTAEAPVPQTAYSTNTELRTAIVDYAMQYLGNAYIHGGRSLADGTDCSGFTCYIYADYGYSISRTPSGQLSSAGRSIDYSEIQPGDIICYTSNGSSCTHVGLYIGDGQIIHAANQRKGVIISAADYSTIMGVKNVID